MVKTSQWFIIFGPIKMATLLTTAAHGDDAILYKRLCDERRVQVMLRPGEEEG